MALRIVAVDDSPTIRALMKNRLGGAGYEVTLCANGMEAVPIIKANPPDLVVSDVSMPHMDGFTLCRSLKEAGETAHVPVVMFTRLDDAREVLRGLDAGADGFVVKGAKREELLESVEAALREARDRARRRSVAKDIGSELSLTSGRKAIFKTMFEALRREVPFDVLAVFVTGEDGAGSAIVVSSRALPKEAVDDIVQDTAKTVADLTEMTIDVGVVARETLVLDASAPQLDVHAKPSTGARVPLAGPSGVFGALGVYAVAPDSTFDSNIRFFFDVGVEAAATLRRVSVPR
jgi:DNA-binding response OmpR family regulator